MLDEAELSVLLETELRLDNDDIVVDEAELSVDALRPDCDVDTELALDTELSVLVETELRLLSDDIVVDDAELNVDALKMDWDVEIELWLDTELRDDAELEDTELSVLLDAVLKLDSDDIVVDD